jgi:hypothetical protein
MIMQRWDFPNLLGQNNHFYHNRKAAKTQWYGQNNAIFCAIFPRSNAFLRPSRKKAL